MESYSYGIRMKCTPTGRHRNIVDSFYPLLTLRIHYDSSSFGLLTNWEEGARDLNIIWVTGCITGVIYSGKFIPNI